MSRSETPLACGWSFFFFSNPTGASSSESYQDSIHELASFNTVESFWSIYCHLRKPNDLDPPNGYHLFRTGVRAIWEDADNAAGGKWLIRLRKGLGSYYWERLIIGLIGEQFPSDVVGAVVSLRPQEAIIAVWNRSGGDRGIRDEICAKLCAVLELPPDTRLGYKKHDDTGRDGTYRNIITFQAGDGKPFEVHTQQQQGLFQVTRRGKK
jgi:translation initiation factor 4E